MARPEITLASLRSFVRAKETENEPAEIREFILTNVDSVAALFGKTGAELAEAVELVDDVHLASRLLATITDRVRSDRAASTDSRHRAACEAASTVVASGEWREDRFYFHANRLFAGLGAPGDRLMISDDAGTWTHAIPVRKLAQTAALKKRGMVGWVDVRGIHFRWENEHGGKGGLSFVSQSDGEGALIPMALPARMAAAPAAPEPTVTLDELTAPAANEAELAPKPRRARPQAHPQGPSVATAWSRGPVEWQPFVSAKGH